MQEKKILLVNSGSLFPMLMASQDRVLKMALRLSLDHQVDLATIVTNSDELEYSSEYLERRINRFLPIISLNYNMPGHRRKILGLQWLLRYILFGISSRPFYWGHRKVVRQLENIIKLNKYDIVQVEGWYIGKILCKIPPPTFKAIDTHDVLYEQKLRVYKKTYGDRLPWLKKREVAKDKLMEISTTRFADLVISISEQDSRTFKTLAPQSKHIMIPTGQDIHYYGSYQAGSGSVKPTLLFYGSLGSGQNRDAFFRFYRKVFPLIKNRISDIHLLILGSAPPPEIIRLSKKENIEVTGYVDDVRPFIARASVMILPMSIAAGFRSRVVEVMAMGVPVVGTHNALDSVGLSDGVEGCIEDDDELLAKRAIELLENRQLLKTMGNAAREFVKKKYGIEETYGKLSRYYGDL